MKLSDIPEYRDYAFSFAHGNPEEAEQALIKCLTYDIADHQRSLIYHFLGGLYRFNKDIDKAKKYFLLSQKADLQSLHPQLLAARFYLNQPECKHLSADICNQMLERLRSENNLLFDDEMDENYYKMAIEELLHSLK